MTHLSRTAAALTAVALTALPAVASAALIFNFDDGTLQGWTNVRTSTTPGGSTSFGVSDPLGPSITPNPRSGNYMVGPDPFGADGGSQARDNPNQTLVLSSPSFYLDGSGDISAWLVGGMGSGSAPASYTSLPTNSSTSGYLGVALRRLSDGAYLLAGNRTSNFAGSWQQVTFSAASLTSYVSPTQTYALDLIDYRDGSWGWVGLDDVTIAGTAVPLPNSVALLAAGALAMAAIRRRREGRTR